MTITVVIVVIGVVGVIAGGNVITIIVALPACRGGTWTEVALSVVQQDSVHKRVADIVPDTFCLQLQCKGVAF